MPLVSLSVCLVRKFVSCFNVQLRQLVPSNIRRQIEGQKLENLTEESHLPFFNEDRLRFFDNRTTQVQGRQRNAK